MCSAHYMYPDMSKIEIHGQVLEIHVDLGFNCTYKVSLADVSKFEHHMGVNIFVFHHNYGTKKLELYQTCHSKTA